NDDNVEQGDIITYTIDIENTGGSPLNNVVVTDALPAGTTYVAESTLVDGWYRPVVNYEYKDEFDSVDYNGDDGATAWTTSWTEIGDDNNAGNGEVLITGGQLSFSGGNGGDAGLEELTRAADLTGATTATLSLKVQGSTGDNALEAGDKFYVDVSDDGSTWTNLVALEGTSIPTSATTLSYDIGLYANANTQIRIYAEGLIESSGPFWSPEYEEIFIDDITVTFSAGSIFSSTKDNIPAGVNGDVTDGVPADLVVSADAFYLGANGSGSESMTVTYQVTVDDPVTGGLTTIDNTVRVTSDELTLDEVTDSVSDNILTSIIGDTVWHDVNGDGVQDAGEPGIAGVEVKLYAADGTTLLDTVTTDSSGNYSFVRLSSGDYIVEVTKPTGASLTAQDAGAATEDKDSDFADGTSRTGIITLAPGEDNIDIDAGLAYANTLGDTVWHDADGNGIQDGGEPGIQGVTVELMDSTGTTVLGTTTTGATGSYSFTNLLPADYVVRVVPLVGTSFTTQDEATATEATDSDVTPADGKSASVTMAGDTVNSDVDAGLIYNNSLGDKVWQDIDGDGEQDGSEPGVDGVTVELRKVSDDSVVATDVTVSGGLYNFSNITPGEYYIQVSVPANNNFTGKDAVG
ncbi:MAG: SdrD B-like domain-containing protein, partial [Candidatus Electrothrix sp.]